MNKIKHILAFDQSQLDNEAVYTAYFRITPEMRDFLTKCIENHGIVGFTYDKGELNFGIILGSEKVEEKI